MVSHATDDVMKGLDRQGISYEAFKAQRQPHSINHNRSETPLFAASIERAALGVGLAQRARAGGFIFLRPCIIFIPDDPAKIYTPDLSTLDLNRMAKVINGVFNTLTTL